jgi:hypothetical protein
VSVSQAAVPRFGRGCRYAIHFGGAPAMAAEHVAHTVAAAHPDKAPPPVTPLARLRNAIAVIPTSTGDQLVREGSRDLEKEKEKARHAPTAQRSAAQHRALGSRDAGMCAASSHQSRDVRHVLPSK